MKMICIKKVGISDSLTIGKEYDMSAFEYNGAHFLTINDGGLFDIYPKSWFISVEEYRQKRLEELGI